MIFKTVQIRTPRLSPPDPVDDGKAQGLAPVQSLQDQIAKPPSSKPDLRLDLLGAAVASFILLGAHQAVLVRRCGSIKPCSALPAPPWALWPPGQCRAPPL